MLQKTKKVVATFAGTHDAMEAEKLCRDAGVPGRLIPIPTDITADCGLCFMMPPEEKTHFMEALAGKVEPQGYYERLLRG